MASENKSAKPKIHTFGKGMKVRKYAKIKESPILQNGRESRIKRLVSLK